jgi:hypothetical protein
MLQSSKDYAKAISLGKSMGRWFPQRGIAAALGRSPPPRPEIYAGSPEIPIAVVFGG